MRTLSSKQARAHAIPQSVKLIVTRRDGGRCVYCGKPGNPEAHFVPRSLGGLGIPQNILTLCRECHDKFDYGDRETRDGMREYFREYLETLYPEWDETKLTYNKWEAFK